jgi:hypothetical protein
MMNTPLKRSAPEAEGIASSSILSFVEAVEEQIHDLHSFMLLRHGSVVAEGWWSPYGADHSHMLFSLSKSFTSSAIGLAVNEGCLTVDDPVISFFPDDLPASVSDNLAAMRVRHLLSMSTGHDKDTMKYLHEREDGNWIRAFLERPVVHTPGTHFLYNTGATYVLSAIVQKLTGMKLIDYLRPRLFEPLGIDNPTWEESPQGINTGGYGLSIKTEDIARFGQMYLNKGMWQGKRILTEAWVEEASSRHISNGSSETSDWEQGYGYQFWRCRHDAYRGDGAFGQYCIVMTEQDAVLAITGGLEDMQVPLNLVWEHLLPAMQPAALEANVSAQEALRQKLASLKLAPPQGRSAAPVAAAVSGREYKFEANEVYIDSISLAFSESGCVVTTRTQFGESNVTCGYGTWHEGTAPTPVADAAPVVASGVWTADDTFTTTLRFYETPFVQTARYQFADHELKLDLSVNVSFDQKDYALVGRSS